MHKKCHRSNKRTVRQLPWKCFVYIQGTTEQPVVYRCSSFGYDSRDKLIHIAFMGSTLIKWRGHNVFYLVRDLMKHLIRLRKL
ncbi:hypothetical protein BDA99DRAFT_523236, partial [Phascolomyces articulosus]